MSVPFSHVKCNENFIVQISSLEWDNSCNEKEKVAEVTLVAESSSQPLTDTQAIGDLESKINQLADDNEQYQDLLEELKAERQAAEAEMKEKIRNLEIQLEEKCRLLEQMGPSLDNRDGQVSEAYDDVNNLKSELSALYAELNNLRAVAASAEELKKENENLVDMIRQLSTTGTLDAATVQRLREEINQNAESQGVYHSSDGEISSDDLIDWHGAFNEIQIEVEYLRSQNTILLRQLQEAGIPVWEGMEPSDTGSELPANEALEQGHLRFELDEAVRNLHERDMRCQELTWEITKVTDVCVSIF